ncbi:DUF4189 domain-containing protein [Rhodanobacter sp. L36]|uniref:DUF4189 domain-containing protein n=1 Tax=Rhodanobacter sp. L36 TaxID=1747221 RepID=UPI00131E1D80|nr:DUF4189 domain-containing protein [Rhodanobacter sp. L36]
MNFVSRSYLQAGLLLSGLLILTLVHAQQPGVDCAPIQGQGWSGCAPINPSQPPTQGQQSQVSQQPPMQWATRWGAIATDADKAILSGITDRSSKEAAQQAALTDCRNKGGTQCKLQIAYDNQCAVMILGDKAFNVANAATVGEATKLGTQQCNKESPNCRVYYSACSLPQRIQ